MDKMSTDALPLAMSSPEKRETVCIFGTGDFGRSLGFKMIQCDYHVVFGSRNPQASSLLTSGAEVLSYAEAARRSDIIILTIHREHYSFLTELTEVLNGKILVDVSNNLRVNEHPESNAEYLAQLMPKAHVVKAFNTISAWALQSGALDASRQVRQNELTLSVVDGSFSMHFPKYCKIQLLPKNQLCISFCLYVCAMDNFPGF